MELSLHVLQRLVEVPHQGAADAPGGHLADLHAGLLQKAAVNADLAELVLDQHQLFAGKGLRQQLFDKSGFWSWYQVLCLKFLPYFILPSNWKKATPPEKNSRIPPFPIRMGRRTCTRSRTCRQGQAAPVGGT
ncbi:Uncharacterised protein [uncultured Blautia sp.]|nr:Uncharacterised protein [uncultured Blautia sp.]